jgi:hypothetical protein
VSGMRRRPGQKVSALKLVRLAGPAREQVEIGACTWIRGIWIQVKDGTRIQGETLVVEGAADRSAIELILREHPELTRIEYAAEAALVEGLLQITRDSVSPDEHLLERLCIFLPRASRARWLEEWRAELAEVPAQERNQFFREVLAALFGMAVALRRPGLRRAP